MTSVLFVTTVPITLEAFLVPFARHFRALGWCVDALSNGAAEDERIAGDFDHRFDISWSRNPLDPGNLLGSPKMVRRIVAEGGYDIVHVHTPIAAFVTRLALRRLPRGVRPRIVYTAHGFHFYRGGSPLTNALYRLMERVAAPWTDYLVTINDEDYDAARRLGGIDSSRVRRIPGIGVDTALFAPDAVPPDDAAEVRRGLGVAEDAFALTMIAEFAALKRHAFVLDGLARVTDPRVVLVLVGAGPLEASLRARAAALGVEERVRWAGYRRDVPDILAASDALVLASEREGLPRSVLEAMSSGRPVIGTRTRGIVDALGTGTGWIVAKHDAAALAAAIDAAAADPAEAARRGLAARARVEAEFALPRIIEAYEELYREALASPQ
jgi:glycosyltransferase involved in cell wall biosynthesis